MVSLSTQPGALPVAAAGPAGMAGATALHRPVRYSTVVNADRLMLLALIDRVVVPELVALHAALPPRVVAADPHAAELARLLVATQPKAALALIEERRAGGHSFATLCACLFEPAARALGALWQDDSCSEFDVALGLHHLQGALRRISQEYAAVRGQTQPWSTSRAVLVAASPHETHTLGSAITSELFWRAGWDVSCEYPRDDNSLSRLVRERWFDVLQLSLSGAFLREHRLPALAASIRAAHANSRNPALVVIVGGRIFHERPEAYVAVGAHAGSTTALDLVSRATVQLCTRDA